jgi:sensor histidine kinase regulating citrate/malate metabolism
MKVESAPKIDIRIYNEGNYLVIKVANSIKESVLKYNPNLQSTKKDKSKHGFGTVSTKDIVKNHNGMIRFYEKNNQFITDIWLKPDKKD